MPGFENGKTLKVPHPPDRWVILNGGHLPWKGGKGIEKASLEALNLKTQFSPMWAVFPQCDRWTDRAPARVWCVEDDACRGVCVQAVGKGVRIPVYQVGSDDRPAVSHVPQQLPSQLGWGAGWAHFGLVLCSSLPRLSHIGLWSESLGLFK